MPVALGRAPAFGFGHVLLSGTIAFPLSQPLKQLVLEKPLSLCQFHLHCPLRLQGTITVLHVFSPFAVHLTRV